MSTAAAHSDNEHHVASLGFYLGIFGCLLVLTTATVLVSTEELFHGAMSLGVAMGIALIKGTLVATFFMHLKGDKTFYTLVFLTSLWFVALFFSFTMFDLSNRGRINPMLVHGVPEQERHAAAEAEADREPPAEAAPAPAGGH